MALFLAYNLLAFGLQPLFGLGVDRAGRPREAAVFGALLVAAALALSLAPGSILVATVAAGLGNALFHVGGGAISIGLTPGGASAPGVFVAPGAAGLAAGTLLARTGGPVWALAVALAALSLGLLAMPRRALAARPIQVASDSADTGSLRLSEGAELAVGIVLVVIMLRSFTGFAIVLPWRSSLTLLGWLTAAIVAGKALGGVLADRFGRVRVGVGSLVISAPLLVAAAQSPVAGVLGMLAFNMTMAVTLVAIADTLPEQPAFAFGLASFALVVGALPVLLGIPVGLRTSGPIVTAVAVAAALLALALVWLNEGTHHRAPQRTSLVEVSE